MGSLTLSPHTIPEQALTRLEGPPNRYEYHDVSWRSRHCAQWCVIPLWLHVAFLLGVTQKGKRR